ncbi:MAG: N-acetyltransferase family protein [Rhizobiaceae bacterium]
MNGLIIRPAAAADLVTVTAIYADAVENGTSSYELDPPGLAEMTQRFDALRSAVFPYIVAEERGHIVGYAYAGAFRPRPAYRFAVEDSIYVAPQAQGRGIGRLLLQRLIEECRNLGFRQMLAVIGDARPESGSVRLHERLGFVHAGLIKGTGYKHGRWLDTGFMQLEMNGGTELAPDPESLPERRFLAGRIRP